MASNNSNEWVREGTPREDWDTDTDYGVEVDPAEWDDYSAEQSVPVPTPAAARDYQPPTDDERGADEGHEARGEESMQHEPSDFERATELDEGAENRSQERLDGPSEFEMAREQDIDSDALAAPADGLVSPAEAHEDEGTDPTSQPTAEVPEGFEDAPMGSERPRPMVVDEVADEHDRQDPIPAETQAAEQLVADESRQDEVVDPAEGDAFDEARSEGVDEAEPESFVADDRSVVLEDEDATRHYDIVHDEPVEEPVTEGENLADEPADEESPVAAPAAGVAAGAGAAGFASLYREDREAETDVDATEHIDLDGKGTETAVVSRYEEEEAEEQARQARLQEQRDARDARLGVVPGAGDSGVRVVEKPVMRQADRGFGAFSLFLFRVGLAAIIGVLGYQTLTNIDGAAEFLGTTVIPEPRLVAWILGFAFVTMAVLLVLGFGARLIGFLVLAVGIASLATIRWGQFSIFQPGLEGFLGDRTLLTALSGLVVMAFGAGRFSIDGAIAAGRRKAKADRSE